MSGNFLADADLAWLPDGNKPRGSSAGAARGTAIPYCLLVLPLALAVLVLAGLLRLHTVFDSAPRAVYEASPSAAKNDSAPRHSKATRPILKVLN
jgi:hypothetical protein